MTSTRGAWGLRVRDLALDLATVDTVALLQDAGIDVLLLKGPVSATRLYGAGGGERHYCDVDLLVVPAAYDAAQRVLRSHDYRSLDVGLRPREQAGREVTWLTPGGSPVPIDLHRSLAWVDDPTALWNALWRGRTTVTVCGEPIPAPDLAGTALIVALHAGRPGHTQQPYRDLERAVGTLEHDQWVAAAELAREAGALPALAMGLGAVPAGRPVLHRLGLTVDAPVARRMHTPDLSPAGAEVAHLLDASGTRAKARWLLARALPSAALMRRYRPIAHTRRALLAAHLGRWSRFARGVPRAVVEVTSVARAARSGREPWTDHAVLSVRRDLVRGGLESVDLAPPGWAVSTRRMQAVLRRQGASCLEAAVVRQRFDAAHGRPRDLVIGVSAPGAQFHAHAWLTGDPQVDVTLHELTRRPAPATWSSGRASRLSIMSAGPKRVRSALQRFSPPKIATSHHDGP